MHSDELPVQRVPPDLEEVWACAANRLGIFAEGLHYFETVTSTNDLAMRMADAGAREGVTLLAEAQTAGRGRRGREWFSPPGSGLYVSVILRPTDTAPSQRVPVSLGSRITLAAGVGLAEGLRASTGLPVELKWPNDLVFQRRKVGGILTEMAVTGSHGDASDVGAQHYPEDRTASAPREPRSGAVVLGFGINVGVTSYPPSLAGTATSIETELGRPIDRALVLVELLAALAARYRDFCGGRFDAIRTAWRKLAASLPGTAIEWDTSTGVMRGRAIDIDRDGALLVETEAGITRLVSADVRWL